MARTAGVTPPAGSAASRRVGRFELQRLLGRGAQGAVWLAHDPRLDRPVALKLLDPGADPLALDEWLQEARAVSRLAHPHIVPVFEADAGGGTPFLVFEYVPGPTLAEARRARVRWPPREAVALMLGVLDALAAAHEQGIVHRDLKPSNVLLGSDGRPRVMDFGIAARVLAPVAGNARAGMDAAAAPGVIVGTAGYISPEAARGEAPVPAMDVFAAGVMLAELLAGEPPLRESDPHRALQRVLEEDLSLAADVEVDAVLRGIVQRALARDRALRHDGARALHAALAAWLEGGDAPAESPPAVHGTLDFLLRRMRRKSDFPALSQSVVRIQRLATSDTETLGRLSDAILEDVALTHKLLRMVNSAHFRLAAGGGVGTISRAVALVGFAGVRNMALSLVLLEHMNDKQHALHLEQEFVRALMAGTLAGELAAAPREAEEAYLASLFQNLGRLLTEFYLPEEALQIRQSLPSEGVIAARREAAAARVLGLGFAELGLGVARQWGLPETLQRAMRAPEGAPPARLLDRGVDRLHWLGRGANELTDVLLGTEGAAQERALLAVAETYALALAMPARQMLAATERARQRLATLTQAMGLSVARDSPARRLLAASAPGGALDATAATALAGSAAGTSAAMAEAPTLVLPASTAATRSAAAVGELAAGLAEVSAAAAAPRARLDDVLALVLKTLHEALDLRCAVFALRDPSSQALCGRFGVGAVAPRVSRALRVPLGAAQSADLFATLCAKGADTLIADTRAGTVASRLPDWYRQHVQAQTFMLLPLMLKGAPVGLLYGDKATAGTLLIGEAELALVRHLRDQVVRAFTAARH